LPRLFLTTRNRESARLLEGGSPLSMALSPFDASNCVGAANVQSGAYEIEREGRPMFIRAI
jgi:hypothetical protein